MPGDLELESGFCGAVAEFKPPLNILDEESALILAIAPVSGRASGAPGAWVALAAMDLFQIPFFDIVRSRMTWLEQRQDLLAENIANAATPRYTPQDVKPVEFGKLLAHEAQATGLQPFPHRLARMPAEGLWL